MPLATRSNGQQISAAFFNDIKDLLKGNIVDDFITHIGNLYVRARGGAPGALTATVVAGGSIDVGNHTYWVTFLDTNGGETVTGTSTPITTTSTNKQANLTNIPIGPTGTVSRRIYRSKLGNSFGNLVTTINDNTTTTYTDAAADSALLSTTPPSHPTFGGAIRTTDSAGTQKSIIYSDGAADFNGQVTAASFAGPGAVGAKIAVYDGALGTVRLVTFYEGSTDPSTYTTPSEGDIWLNA